MERRYLVEKHKHVNYQIGCFCGGNNTIKLTTYNNTMILSKKIQRYVVKWNHAYLLHTLIDRMESNTYQHIYWPETREAYQKEVINCEVFQPKKVQTKNMVNYQLSSLAE